MKSFVWSMLLLAVAGTVLAEPTAPKQTITTSSELSSVDERPECPFKNFDEWKPYKDAAKLAGIVCVTAAAAFYTLDRTKLVSSEAIQEILNKFPLKTYTIAAIAGIMPRVITAYTGTGARCGCGDGAPGITWLTILGLCTSIWTTSSIGLYGLLQLSHTIQQQLP